MKTLSDRELDTRIKNQEKTLAKCKPGTWTYGKIETDLNYLRAQRALPRDQRCKYRDGSI